MEKFLSILLTLFIISFVFKLIFRLILPFIPLWIAKHYDKKLQKHFQEDETQRTQAEDEEIELGIRKKPGKSISDELGGEYVDFEEVK